ncbi:hypothetical protein M0802_001926 [Mischocyttarus mexicanus]|nr:hypothetical protein M0802_001926 [Mischocyttarus mexicanus]
MESVSSVLAPKAIPLSRLTEKRKRKRIFDSVLGSLWPIFTIPGCRFYVGVVLLSCTAGSTPTQSMATPLMSFSGIRCGMRALFKLVSPSHRLFWILANAKVWEMTKCGQQPSSSKKKKKSSCLRENLRGLAMPEGKERKVESFRLADGTLEESTSIVL